MKDFIIKGNGNSRYLKSSLEGITTWEQFRAALAAGTLPIDLNGINPEGFQQLGDPLNKATLLKDDTAALLGLGTDAVPDDAWQKISKAVVPIGTVLWYTSQTAPSSFLICDGSTVSRADYADLFSVIGETFGKGDGSTTFSIPDLRNRFIRGIRASSSGSGGNLGENQQATTLNTIIEGTGILGYNFSDDVGASTTQNYAFGSTYQGRSGRYITVRPHNVSLTPIIRY